MATTYKEPSVIVRQQFQNVTATVGLETLQAVIIGPSWKKIKDNDSSATDKKIDLKYANESMVFNMPEMPADCVYDEDSFGIRITNKSKTLEVDKAVSKGNCEDNGSIAVTGEGTKVVVSSDIEIAAEEGDVLTITSLPYDGEYSIISVGEDKKSFIIDIDDQDRYNDIEDGVSVEHLSFNIATPGYTYDPEEEKFYLSGQLGISGTIYLRGRAFRRDLGNDIILAKADDLEEIFGAGEVNSENPLALGMQIALANIGGGDDNYVAGIAVESDDVLGYQKALQVLETKGVYALVPLTTNMAIPQVLMAHCDALSDPLEGMERVGIFASPWMNREVKYGQLMVQAADGSYDFVKGQITSSGKPLNDNFIGAGMRCDMDGETHTNDNPGGNVYTGIVAIVSEPAALFSFKIDGEEYSENFENGILTMTGSFRNISFKSDEVVANEHISVYMYADSKLKEGSYETKPVLMEKDGSTDIVFNSGSLRALRVKVIDMVDGNVVEDEVIPNGITLSVKCENADEIITDKISTTSYDTVIQKVTVNGEYQDRYGIILIGLKENGTYKINRLVGGNTDPDVATFMSSGVEANDELVIIDKSSKDDTTYSGYAEKRYRVAKANKENELTINAVWDEETQQWDSSRVFPEAVDSVYYRVESPVITDKMQLAEMYANISAGFGNRRITHVFAPYVGISEDNEEHQVPGYYMACAYAGATQRHKASQGFTNMSFAGITSVRMTNDYFTKSQLNKIASGGTAIFVQENEGAPVTCRHQLTTNMDTIETREYSITRIMDYIAKCARVTKRPYIGKYNINTAFLEMMGKLGEAILSRMVTDEIIISGNVTKVIQDPDQKDKIIECYQVQVPYPCNYIDITLVL